MRTHWVMDFETLSNCFIAVFEDIKTEDKEIFVCHKSKNDILELVAFLNRNIQLDEWHVSFNGLSFDSQITEHIIRNEEQLVQLDGDAIAKFLYGKAQDIIFRQNNDQFSEFSPWNLHIKQIDLFKLNHWDNHAKRSSLKWIQYTMDWKNIMDMPIHHTTEIEADQIDTVIEYCINDVKSTKAIMYLCKEQIALRKSLTEEYNIDLFSASEPKISKELFSLFLSNQTGIKKFELKKMRTYRSNIIVDNIILPYVSFKTATFQTLLNKFRAAVIYTNETKGGFKYSVQYRGVKTDYGLGGIHGARKSGIYTSNEDMVIMTSDVTSFYPNLAIRNKWAPAHLPQDEFCALYEWFFEERKKIPKKDPKNYVYKIILNSTYGLSNEENSFLYDPELTMRITINGQLSLTMLYEMICEEIPGAVPLMQNTDGLETAIPRQYVDKYHDICNRWEKLTNLQLEHDTYSKIVLGDVNNYIAVGELKKVHPDIIEDLKKKNPHDLYEEREDGVYHASIKCKGRFEFSNLALHKNKSFLIIPQAIFYYFVHGVKPEDYLNQNRNIFDYCGGVKIKGDWKFVEHKIIDGEYQQNKIQDTIRYYISKSGSKIIKTNKSDKRERQIEAGKWMQTLFINYIEKDFDEYDIDFSYYLNNINKEIYSLEGISNQISLF